MTLNHSQIEPVNVWSAREHMTKVESKNLKRQITRLGCLRRGLLFFSMCCTESVIDSSGRALAGNDDDG